MTSVVRIGREAKIVVRRQSKKPGDIHPLEVENTCGGVHVTGGRGDFPEEPGGIIGVGPDSTGERVRDL